MPDSKVFGFTGIKQNINVLADRNSLIKCTNMDIHVKPGILTTRPSYWLKYETPTDTRIDAAGFISFDNFFEKEASDEGVEVTLEIQKGTIKSDLTTYSFNGINLFIRPYWNGVYYEDKWQWLNETYITKIVSIDATYLNKIIVSGDLGNLTQWVIVNVTKNISLPVAILAYEQGANTTLYTSLYSHNWEVDDELVIMRNYIPLTNQAAMYETTKQEISFHRLPSKIRIGFGGKENRLALGVEYVKRTIQIADYAFTNTDTFLVGKEMQFAQSNKIIAQPYTQFNNLDFDLNILTAAGTPIAGTYYFRMTAVLDGFNEVLVLSKSITTTSASKFLPIPKIKLGSISRRLSAIKIYFSESGIDYYLFKEYPVSLEGNQNVTSKDWNLDNDGYLSFQDTDTGTEIYTETSSAHDTTDNAVGSWLKYLNFMWNEIIATGSVGDYYLTVNATAYANLDTYYYMGTYILDSVLDIPIKNNRLYSFTIKAKATNGGFLTVGFMKIDESGLKTQLDNKSFIVIATDLSYSFDLTSPDLTDFSPTDQLAIFAFYNAAERILQNDYISFTNFTIIEKQTTYIDSLPTGALDITEMGYTPSLNLVKDWATAVVINGQTFVGAGYIEKRFPNLIFYSPVAGTGANQYDVLPASKFLDSDKDNHRGEIIIGLTSLLNLSLLVLTENGGVVIDPSAGSTLEVARGYGLITKESIQKFRGIIFWASFEDIVCVSASSGYDPQVISEDSIREYYNAMINKLEVSSCIDDFGTYHIALTSTDVLKEFIWTSRGWTDYSRAHQPVVMRNGYLGRVWFCDSTGNVYSLPTPLEGDIGFADIYSQSYKEW